MSRQGQVFKLKARGVDGQPRWACLLARRPTRVKTHCFRPLTGLTLDGLAAAIGASPKPVPNESPLATHTRARGAWRLSKRVSAGARRATRLATPSLLRRCSIAPIQA